MSTNTFTLQGDWDRLVGTNALVGASVFYGNSSIDVDTRATGDLDTFMFGIYGSWWYDAFAVDGSLAYGHHWSDINRRIAYGNIRQGPNSSPSWNQVSRQLIGSYSAMFQSFTLKPYPGLLAIHYDRYKATETGGGSVGLAINRKSDSVIDGLLRLGKRLGAVWAPA